MNDVIPIFKTQRNVRILLLLLLLLLFLLLLLLLLLVVVVVVVLESFNLFPYVNKPM